MHETVFFTKNDKKMIVKKDKNTLPPLKNVHFGGGAVTIITQRFSLGGCGVVAKV